MKTLAKEQWKDRVVGFERRAAKDFQANSLNFRRHPNSQRDAFRGVVAELGFAGAVLENTRTGNLIDGHLRIEEALSIDQDMLIPCVQVDLSEAEEKLLLASYDPISAMATADKETLELLLKDVSSSDEAVNAMLAKLAEDTGLSYGVKEEDESKVGELIDRAEELRVKWDTKTGQLWEIASQSLSGRFHRLLVGDSTQKADVGRLCGSSRPSCVFTDPPYGIGYRDVKGKFDPITNDECDPTEIVRAAYSDVGLTIDTPVYICCDWRSLQSMRHAAAQLGLQEKAVIVWDKERGVQNLDRYFKQHEFILYCGPYGGEKSLRGDVWRIKREINEGLTPTPKPAALISIALEDACKAGYIVYDFFLGGGTTMVAAEQTGRICYAMEIEPKYCAVTLERMSNLGLEARLTT